MVPLNANKNIAGRRIKEARRKFSPTLTQDELSGKLATLGVVVDRAAIAKIENGIRCVYDFELGAFAAALKTDVRWLLGIVDTRASLDSKTKPRRSRK